MSPTALLEILIPVALPPATAALLLAPDIIIPADCRCGGDPHSLSFFAASRRPLYARDAAGWFLGTSREYSTRPCVASRLYATHTRRFRCVGTRVMAGIHSSGCSVAGAAAFVDAAAACSSAELDAEGEMIGDASGERFGEHVPAGALAGLGGAALPTTLLSCPGDATARASLSVDGASVDEDAAPDEEGLRPERRPKLPVSRLRGVDKEDEDAVFVEGFAHA